jgi:hypothetical protein
MFMNDLKATDGLEFLKMYEASRDKRQREGNKSLAQPSTRS